MLDNIDCVLSRQCKLMPGFNLMQASIVTLWSGQQRAPWIELRNQDSLARLMTIFITWSALRLFQGILNVA